MIKTFGKITPWLVTFSAALFFCYEIIQMHMLNAISPFILKDLQINATQFGYLSSTYLFAVVLFLLPAGMILDRFSTRRVILIALTFCIVGTVGFALSTTLWMASLTHFFSGIGNGFCFLSCMMLVSRWFPANKQAFVVGLVVTVGLLGGVIAQSPLSMLAQAFNWRNALLIDAALGVFIFILNFLFVQDKPSTAKETEQSEEALPFWEGVRRSIFNKQNVLCGCYTSLMNLPVMIIGAVWGSLFLTQIHKIPLIKASFIVSMICLGTIVGSPIFGYLSDRNQSRRGWMVFGALCSLLLISLLFVMPTTSHFGLAILFFLIGFFTSTQVIGYPAITESNPKNLTGTSMGIAAVIIMGLPAIIQPFTGQLLDLGWNGAMIDGAPLYSLRNFLTAFSIFPVGFFLSFLAAMGVKDMSRKPAFITNSAVK